MGETGNGDLYRPNHARSIHVIGVMDDSLAQRVLIDTERLRAESRDPITVYIHSSGGSIRVLDLIHGALKSADADEENCRIITVTLGDAASAAAFLLCLGDYAIARPHSTVHFHGIRLSDLDVVTMERASNLSEFLTERN